MALFGRLHPDLIPGKSICIDVGGGWEKAGLVGRVEIFVPVSWFSRRAGEMIVKGISTANKIIQREERVGSTLPEKQGTGERAAARQCLPRGEGERPAAETSFQLVLRALGRIPLVDENPGPRAGR